MVWIFRNMVSSITCLVCSETLWKAASDQEVKEAHVACHVTKSIFFSEGIEKLVEICWKGEDCMEQIMLLYFRVVIVLFIKKVLLIRTFWLTLVYVVYVYVYTYILKVPGKYFPCKFHVYVSS
jgi:hypothetical protein